MHTTALQLKQSAKNASATAHSKSH